VPFLWSLHIKGTEYQLIFMAAGSHVKKDLPRLAADAIGRYEGLLIELAAPVGEAESVLAAMADYAIGAKPKG
jgi:sirohydrochlorin cobaltochelatase